MYCDMCDVVQPCDFWTTNGEVHGCCSICGAPIDENLIYDGIDGTEQDFREESFDFRGEGFPDAGGWD